ncbi:unnamed protein product [Polarella glacialis]|uniref:Protein kinase domain-containing protein n=1 Tax=Polarella glacialis TaxID=89957 RepID=A0A813GTG7_POLGL|nr:unnamed protein product [Polarella glacialis]
MISATSEVDIKVCDFGIAKLADQVHIFSGSHLKPLQGSVTISTAPALPRSDSFKGSDFYLAPEMIRQEEYGSEVDLWALGVTSYCLLSASMPFVGEGGCDDLRGTYRKIVQRDFSFEKEAFDETSSEAKEFISRLLSLEPRQRPKATQAMLLSWITGFALKGLTSAQITEEDDDGDDEDDSDDHDPEDEEVDDEDANEPQGCIMHERLENKHDTCDF